MKYYRRITALCAALPLLLAGCGEKEPDFTKEAELPYGATMRSDKNSYAVPITYDRRFFDETQVAKVANILASVQNLDAALYESSTPVYYYSYQKEAYGCSETTELLENFHAVLAESSGEDFTFNMVLINEISTDLGAGGLAECVALLDVLYDGEGSFVNTVENAWDLTVEWDLAYDGGTQYSVISEEHVYLFQTGDGCFCVM